MANAGSTNDGSAVCDAEAPQQDSGPRVLFVDDEPDMGDLAQALLESQGFRTVCCTSGRSAIERLERERFDLVITDLHLGDTDGLTLNRYVRERHPGVRVILLSGDPETAEIARRFDVHRVLVKPVDLGVLQRAVEGAFAEAP